MNQTQLCCTITNEPLWDFGIQLFATLIGVGLGFWLPVIYEKRQKKKETDRIKQHLMESIILELLVDRKGLDDHDISKSTWDDAKQTFVGKYGIASAPMIHSAINTRNIILLDNELRERLIRVSDRIEHYNWCVKQLITFYTTPIFATGKGAVQAQDLLELTKQQSDALKKEIDETIEYIKTIKE